MAESDAPETVVHDGAEFNPVAVPDPSHSAVPPVAPRRGGFVGAVFGGLIAAGAGFTLAQYVPNGWPFGPTVDLAAQISAQNTQIATLKTALASIPPPDVIDPTLPARLAALEAAPVADNAPIDARLATLEDRLAAIESLPAGANGVSAAVIAAQAAAIKSLQTDVDSLRASGVGLDISAITKETEARLKEAELAASAMKADAEKIAKAARQQAALGQLRTALENGTPYGDVLSEIGSVPAVLTENAQIGLPSLSAVKTAFAPAARDALDIALRANMGESWSERASSFLRSQTGARSTEPREGTDPDAILSRAEAALGRGDLKTALAELSTLPPEAQPALVEWRALAEKRLAGEQAVAAVAVAIGKTGAAE